MSLDRRRLLTRGPAALAFAGLNAHALGAHALGAHALGASARSTEETYLNQVEGYGDLVADPNGLFDLPPGFSYRIVSQGGETMDDGLFVPGQFDGMACFARSGTQVALVRNHELKPSRASHRNWGPGGYRQERLSQVPVDKAFGTFKDGRPLPGGTTTVVYDLATRKVVRQHLSLIGTSTNCGGGPTPWGSWLTCEEAEETPSTDDVTRSHGWVFEVPSAHDGLVEAVPLTAMGRFSHEAVCIDPRTGIAYLTEDQTDGLFYRFLPARPGDLKAGGRLQAMALRGAPRADVSNLTTRVWSPGDWREVVWIDLDHVESPEGDLRKRGHAAGATLISRGEGIHWGTGDGTSAGGELYLAATTGGPIERGQILRYIPSPREGHPDEAREPGRLQLFFESTDPRSLNMGDNLTVAPWGHLMVCEDNYSADTRNHLKGVTPQGQTYTLGRNVFSGNSELAGTTFSPDGSVLFVNIQYPGLTLAIEGPWRAFVGAQTAA